MITVRVDPELCLESGQCIAALPGVFGIDNGVVRLVGPDSIGPILVDPADEHRLRRAADRCPAAAIVVEQSEGGGF